jgi:hypothetical protein
MRKLALSDEILLSVEKPARYIGVRRQLMKARIKFQKYGAMKFIGHLDVMRFFQKAFL